jgi:hypothetical protein
MTLSPVMLASSSQLRNAVRPGRLRKPPLRVWEQPFRYEDEGAERRSLGSVSVGSDAWWSVALSVPDNAGEAAEDTVTVRLERHGAHPTSYRGSLEAQLTLPGSELAAVVVLLAGVVEQARRR